MVLKAALAAGKDAIGFDVDPLAVLMSRVWTAPPPRDLGEAAERVATSALRLRRARLPWIDDDPETSEFVHYWFARGQQYELRRLAAVLAQRPTDVETDALRLALSRIVIAKDQGASLASDVSHSRPHKTKVQNDYNVVAGFKDAARRIGKVLQDNVSTGRAVVGLGDARELSEVPSGSVGMVVTSPPYLNAIDYMRGHRLSLVWLGHRISELRSIRSQSIGSERRWDDEVEPTLTELAKRGALRGLPARMTGILTRYLYDLDRMMSETHRVLRSGAQAVLVIGNSTIRGVYIDNSSFATAVAEHHGFHFLSRSERDLPAAHRYLPPPKAADKGLLSKRMRSEVVLRLQKP